MAEKHPYISGAGGITAAVNQLRKNFPPKISADTFKKLGIAPNNESYLINILRFLDVIDGEGNKTSKATSTFSKHADAEFQLAFSQLVKDAYSELFALRGDDAWKLGDDGLISFFRSADKTSDVVGRRQTGTFQALAALSGQDEPQAPTKPKAPRESKTKNSKPRAVKSAFDASLNGDNAPKAHDFALTLRIEVNLPPAGDQETYDKIFRSIRENLLNAK